MMAAPGGVLWSVQLGSRPPGTRLAWCRSSNLLAMELSETSNCLTIGVVDPSVPEVESSRASKKFQFRQRAGTVLLGPGWLARSCPYRDVLLGE